MSFSACTLALSSETALLPSPFAPWAGKTILRLAALIPVGASLAKLIWRISSKKSKDKLRCSDSSKLSILVTGFYDWKDLGQPKNILRSRDNPSSRLIVGNACEKTPTIKNGVLPKWLRETCPPDWEFHYHLLPVVWGSSMGLDLTKYNVVFHLGLGVYDGEPKILLEDGAINLRKGEDVISIKGEEIPFPLGDPLGPRFLRDAEMTSNVRSLDGHTIEGFRIKAMKARPENAYLCNETHYRALETLRTCRTMLDESMRKLRGVYFIHIPYAGTLAHSEKKDSSGGRSSYDLLGRAVAMVIRKLSENAVQALWPIQYL
eukprot:CAMPEP_0114487646 /NCGR_PEP_ID=MMETSP0109-20121206/888_1 /TAXON_ID=29199 /ORGANISM="Chlorarachnion reptans, Strain CCCM449" /LENGTH=317 /DNA_ID=CAMNT_0001663947 /DNA_START=233 /DNA_END=1186 /DNA_ORIENTATION=+